MKTNIQHLAVVAVLFFLFGFLTWLNSVLIAFLKIICEISLSQAFFVTTSFYISYFIMAIPVAFIIKQLGYLRSMTLGLSSILLGALTFIPAAYTRSYPIFLLGLFIQGAGLTLLQTAVNPYVTLLGRPESAAQRISIMGIANKLAGGFSGLILGSILLKHSETELKNILSHLSENEKNAFLSSLAHEIVFPYLLLGGILLSLILLIQFSSLPSLREKKEVKFSFKNLPKQAWFGFLAIFFYVGAEVIVGDSIILFARTLDLKAQFIEIGTLKINIFNPSYFLTYVMIAMILGYLIGIWLTPKYLSQKQALLSYTLSALLLVTLNLLAEKNMGIWFIVLLGASHAIMWPAIWPLTLQKAGEKIEEASSLLIMGIIGGATLPLLFARLAEKFEIHHAYAILYISYFYILFFALQSKKEV